MANFFESLGRTRALPEALNSLSQVAIQMRQVKNQESRNQREQAVFQMTIDKKNKEEAARNEPLPLLGLKGQLAIPEMFNFGARYVGDAGLINDSNGEVYTGEITDETIASHGLYIKTGDGPRAKELLAGFAPEIADEMNRVSIPREAKAAAVLKEEQLKQGVQPPADPNKPVKKTPAQIEFEEATEFRRIAIKASEEVSAIKKQLGEEKRAKEVQVKKEQSIVTERGRVAKEKATAETKKIDSYWTAIKKLSKTAKDEDKPTDPAIAKSIFDHLLKNQKKSKSEGWKVISEIDPVGGEDRQLLIDKKGKVVKEFGARPKSNALGAFGELFGDTVTKQIDKETANKLLQEAGGDKEKARQLAKERGYQL